MNKMPTVAQINYLARLLDCSPQGVYREVAKIWNCSPSSAERRMTQADASRLIDDLKTRR